MKITRLNILILLAVLAGSYAFAQDDRYSRHSRRNSGAVTNQVPGPDEYDKFTGFISLRNIFDPNRQPRYSSGPRPVSSPTIHHGAPFFMLVGTMSYNKGEFAFFNGNSSDLRQALQVNGKIGDYTVTAVTAMAATIQSADTNQPVTLKIGDRMQEENGKWVFLAGDEMTDSGAPEPTGDESGAASGNSSSSQSSAADNSSATPAPSPALESNDVLKRLMELRAKENQ